MNGKEAHELLGAYLLGGLDDADRLRFRAAPGAPAGRAAVNWRTWQSCRGCWMRCRCPTPWRSPSRRRRPGQTPLAARWPPSRSRLLDELAARRRRCPTPADGLVGRVAAACLALGFAAGAAARSRPTNPMPAIPSEPAPACRSRWVWSRRPGAPNWPSTAGACPQNGRLSLWVKDRDGGRGPGLRLDGDTERKGQGHQRDAAAVAEHRQRRNAQRPAADHGRHRRARGTLTRVVRPDPSRSDYILASLARTTMKTP